MKTLKQWEKSGLDLEDFIHPGDWISEDQGGDPIKSEDGVLFYCTCHHTEDDRYLYLGILPEFKQ